jgi:hypothetical protein
VGIPSFFPKHENTKMKIYTSQGGTAISSNNKQPKTQAFGYRVLKMTCKLNLKDTDSLGIEQRRNMQVTQLANYQNSFTMSYLNPKFTMP